MKDFLKSLFLFIFLFGSLGLVATGCSDDDDDDDDTMMEEPMDECETVDSDASPAINYTWATDEGSALDQSFFEGFGGYTALRIDNPDQSGVNESCNVMQLTRGEGCEVWGGAGTPLSERIDFGSDPGIIKLDVWGEATDVTLRFENLPFPDVDPAIERVVNMTSSGAWETLTFDFSDDTSGNTYGNLILYITRNEGGCANEVYYVDNLRQE